MPCHDYLSRLPPQFPTFATMPILLNLWPLLEQWDQVLFKQINSEWTNSFFDAFLPYLRVSSYWMPLYLFLLVFALLNFRERGLWWFVFFVSTVALTDLSGNYLFKHTIERLRPCNDPNFFMNVRLLADRCGGGYSFISNHAANHFGMATFFYITFHKLIPKWAWVGFAWAGLIAYAQIYVGVHYPLDVLSGALWGGILGRLTGKFYNKRIALLLPVLNPGG